MAAETETGGVQVNIVPRDGANRFNYYFNGNGTGSKFQGANFSADLVLRGLTGSNKIKYMYDIGGGVGGPLKKDKLWFYTSDRWWGADEYAPGNFFNLTPHTYIYTQDPSRPAYTDTYAQD